MVGIPMNGRALPGETRDDYRVWGETVLVPLPCAALGVVGQVASRQ